jgi:1,4-alpha-glucan branching enzyme
MIDDKFAYRTIRFKLHAPDALSVNLAGTFNDWNVTSHPMKLCGKKKNGGGDWQVIMRLLPGIYQYLFYVDGQWWNDPASNQYIPDEFGSLKNVMEVK